MRLVLYNDMSSLDRDNFPLGRALRCDIGSTEPGKSSITIWRFRNSEVYLMGVYRRKREEDENSEKNIDISTGPTDPGVGIRGMRRVRGR